MTMHTDADLGAYALRLERRSHPTLQPRRIRTTWIGRTGRRSRRSGGAAQDFIDTP